MFGRRKKDGEASEVDEESFEDDLDPTDRAAEDAMLLAELDTQQLQQARLEPPNRPRGPWDLADAPQDPERPRIELGGLHVPVPEDAEVRVDVSPEGEVVAATLVFGESALQLNAFAAPRSTGIWDEVRTEIRDALREGGGRAEEAEGPFGTELQAGVPTEVEGGGIVIAPARFLGVDGPRWFLRGLVTGPAAVDPDQAGPVEAALRDVVVVRGSDPMAVRDPLALVLPKEVQIPQPGDPVGLELPERGPEITETR